MKRYFLLLAVLLAGSAQAWDCKFEKEITETMDLSGSDLLAVIAGAGDLEIRGDGSSSEARATGKICASSEEWLDEAGLVFESGNTAELAVVLPDVDSSWGLTGNRYVYMDLEVSVPEGMDLNIRDSSGDLSVFRSGAVFVQDSSGDIEIEDARGMVTLEDSSGDIELVRIDGDVMVNHDSSGDIYGREVQGSVVVAKDSSGDIRFKDVRDDFLVERDSSGDIVADSIGGDFTVLKDGSGSIRSNDVDGEVSLPDKG